MSTNSLNKLYQTKKEYYSGKRSEMLAFLPDSPATVLEVGCGEGGFLALVKEKNPNSETWGVDISEESIKKASKFLDNAICTDLTHDLSPLPDDYFDVIFFNDVLEHLISPQEFLTHIQTKLKTGGTVVASIPNVRHFKVLLMLFFKKDFRYEKAGVMDETHLRFFTKKSMLRLFEDADYTVKSITPINKSKSIRPKIMKLLTLGLIGNDISFLQFVITATKK